MKKKLKLISLAVGVATVMALALRPGTSAMVRAILARKLVPAREV